MNPWMKEACDLAKEGMKKAEGGPFGAVILDPEGNIIGKGNNQVLSQKDPTAHAEIVAIRQACEKRNTYDLKGCTIYTSCQPCPMCLAAIIWANIQQVYYGCTKEEAGEIGFRDDQIYDFIKEKKMDLLRFEQIDHEECQKLMEEYVKNGGVIY